MTGVSAFLWQSAALLLGAYFIGALFGCILRRLLTSPPKVAMEAAGTTAAAGAAVGSTAAAVAIANQPGSEAAQRFGRALDGDDAAPAQEPAPPAPENQAGLSELKRNAPPVAPIEPPAPPAIPPSPPAAETSEASPSPSQATPPATEQAEPDISGAVLAAAAASAAAAVGAAAVGGEAEQSDTAPVSRSEQEPLESPNVAAAPLPPEPAPPQPAEMVPDLPTAAGSEGQAVVAAPVAHDPGDSAETNAVADEAASEVVPSSEANIGAAALASGAAAGAVAGAAIAEDADDLTLIRGVDDATAALLKSSGTRRFAQIAAWGPDDVERMNEHLGEGHRVERENWIEQCQLLARGEMTEFSRRKTAGLDPAVAPPPVPAVEDLPPQDDVPSASQIVPPGEESAPESPLPPEDDDVSTQEAAAIGFGGMAAVAATSAGAEEASANVVSITSRRDNLELIDGINGEVASLLHVQGVTQISQIASWSDEDEKKFDRLLGSSGRVQREGWVRQAQEISGIAPLTPEPEAAEPAAGTVEQSDPPATSDQAGTTGEVATAAAVVAAAAAAQSAPVSDAAELAKSNVTSFASGAAGGAGVKLRSVRSEALVGRPEAGGGDDLKRIRGVGVLIEKKLRAMGYTTYAQVAEWSQDDINRVSQILDFRGRIERENWVEQARILAAGGQTEFSRRFERGDA